MTYQKSLLALAVLAALAAAPLASAQEVVVVDDDAEAAEAAEKAALDDEAAETAALDEVIVTGTRRSDRTVAESLAPIDVLPASEIQATGTPDLQTVLSRLVPSFNYPRTSITDASDHVRPAQLRGLSPDQTLVLVNGKRRHRTAIINVNGTVGRGSSPVDLNAIPIGAIQRIEVLRDGAAAQYGSDAIAGVINIVLKDATEGGRGQFTYGEHEEGDGELVDGWVNAGIPLNTDGSFINFTAEWKDKDFTNRSTPDRRQQYPLVNGQPDPREASFDRINHRFGDAATTDRLLFVNSVLPINDEGFEFYWFGSISDRDGESAGFFRRALDARNVPAVHPNGFLPLIVTDVRDTALVGGMRGIWANDWAWDLSANFGDSQFDFNVHNSVNNSIGATSPTEFYAGTLDSEQAMLNFDVRNYLDVGWLSSPLSTAFGAEYRRESFSIGAGDPASYFGTGSQVFPGFRPSDATDTSRHNYALYADFETDVAEALTMGVAGRFEDYSDFGSEFSGKLSARYAFNDEYALRGTAGTGFRAPNLQQQLYSTTATNFINGVPFDIRTFAVDNPVAIALGSEPLTAEQSTSYSLGFVAQPTDNFSFTIDAYRIEIEDRVFLSENLTGVAVRAFLASQGFPGTDGGRYFTNALDTTTDGIDVVARYDMDFADWGALSTTFGYNRNDTEVDRIAPNPPELSAGNLQLQRIGRVELGRLLEGPPKDKFILGADYTIGAFGARLIATRYGEWTVRAANPVQDETFDAQWVIDLALSWDFGRWDVTVGAENANDQYPREVFTNLVTDANGFVSAGAGDNSNSGILPYARGEAPFGFNGAFYYVKFGFDW